MRKYALISNNEKYKKVMVADVSQDYCIFLYDVVEDTFAKLSRRFNRIEEVDEYINKITGDINEWVFVDDPLEGCNYDLLVNTRRINRADDNTSSGVNLWERYIDGEWKKYLLLDTMEWKSID